MRHSTRLLLASLLAVGGCAPMSLAGKLSDTASPLETPKLAADGVVLEVISVRFPPDDAELTDGLWQQLDEQSIPLEVRRRLLANGFRVGVLAGALPARLEQQIDLRDSPESAAEGPLPVDLENEPLVRGRQLRVRGGKRNLIIVTGETTRHAELSVLSRNEEGQVTGRTYRKVMGLFAAKAFPQGDNSVRLELVPELEHGEAQRRFVASEGVLKVDFGPPHEVFDELRFHVSLATGQMLVISRRGSDCPGSLGHHYFTDDVSGSTMQKLLLVRVAHSRVDDRFTTDPLRN